MMKGLFGGKQQQTTTGTAEQGKLDTHHERQYQAGMMPGPGQEKVRNQSFVQCWGLRGDSVHSQGVVARQACG